MSILNIILMIALVVLIVIACILCAFYRKKLVALRRSQDELNTKLYNVELEKNAIASMKREINAYAEKFKVEHFCKNVAFKKKSSLSLAKFVVGREIIKDIFAKHPEFLTENQDFSWTANINLSLNKENE